MTNPFNTQPVLDISLSIRKIGMSDAQVAHFCVIKFDRFGGTPVEWSNYYMQIFNSAKYRKCAMTLNNNRIKRAKNELVRSVVDIEKMENEYYCSQNSSEVKYQNKGLSQRRKNSRQRSISSDS